MTTPVLWSAALAALLLGAGHAVALPLPPAGLNDSQIDEVREVRAAVPSPDGASVVATITDSTREGGLPHLWLLGEAGAEPRQLTFGTPGDRGEDGAVWAPDGRTIYFIQRGKGGPRLARLSLRGGEPVYWRAPMNGTTRVGTWGPLAESPSKVTAVSLSPDGATLAVVADFTPPPPGGPDPKSYPPPRPTEHLYIGHADGGPISEIPAKDPPVQMSWSRAGDKLAVLTVDPNEGLAPSAGALVLLGPDFTHPATLAKAPGTTQAVQWLADGSGLALIAQCRGDSPPGCRDVYTLALNGAAPVALTGGDGAVSAHLALDADGAIVTSLIKGFREVAARIDPVTRRIEVQAAPLPVVLDLTANAQGTAWAVVYSGPTKPASVRLTTSLKEAGRELATPALLPADVHAVNGRLIHWTSDGDQVEGMLYMPPLPAGAKAPLVVNVHGGPASQFQDRFYGVVNRLVGEGWAVLQPNPRGSFGYGARFLAANKGDLGGGDFRDIMTGVDAAIKGFPIDSQKLALIGYSYGGEMAGFVEGRTDRFKAVVSGAPVIDQVSEYGTEALPFIDRWFYGRPWEHLDSAWRQSPIAFVGRARSPFLLLQGEADDIDPPGQSMQMHQALREVGVKTTMLIFPRETHQTLRRAFFGEPAEEAAHARALRAAMVNFIADAFAGRDPTAP